MTSNIDMVNIKALDLNTIYNSIVDYFLLESIRSLMFILSSLIMISIFFQTTSDSYTKFIAFDEI